MKEKTRFNTLIKTVIVGLSVIFIGCMLHLGSNFINEHRRQNAIEEAEKEKNKNEEKLERINSEHRKVNSQYNAKLSECFAINTRGDGWEEKSNRCKSEERNLQNKILKLQEERDKLSNKSFPVNYKKVNPMFYKVFYIIGTLIVGLSMLGTVIINSIKNKKTYQ